MHRLLVDTDSLKLDSPVLPKDAANHLKVLRPKDGEEIELFDGQGSWRRFRVKGEGRRWDLKSSSGICRLPPPVAKLTLFACVTKGSRWDWTVEKATELGATRVVPVISERTIVRIAADEREAKRERWLRIAEDAARQSDAKWLPEILAPVTFAESLELVRGTNCFVGALTNPPPRMIFDALADHRVASVPASAAQSHRAASAAQSHRVASVPASADQSYRVASVPASAAQSHRVASVPASASACDYSIYVGPEGDFAPDELQALLAIATPVSFGPTVLRAETAAIFGLSVLAAFVASGE